MELSAPSFCEHLSLSLLLWGMELLILTLVDASRPGCHLWDEAWNSDKPLSHDLLLCTRCWISKPHFIYLLSHAASNSIDQRPPIAQFATCSLYRGALSSTSIDSPRTVCHLFTQSLDSKQCFWGPSHKIQIQGGTRVVFCMRSVKVKRPHQECLLLWGGMGGHGRSNSWLRSSSNEAERMCEIGRAHV